MNIFLRCLSGANPGRYRAAITDLAIMGSYETSFALPVSIAVDACQLVPLPRGQTTDKLSDLPILAIA